MWPRVIIHMLVVSCVVCCLCVLVLCLIVGVCGILDMYVVGCFICVLVIVVGLADFLLGWGYSGWGDL